MKTFKFLETTIFVITVPVAIGLATIALLATVISLSVLLGSLTVAVHLLADKNATESATTNGDDVDDSITEIASLGKLSGIVLRVFMLIIKENISRLKSLTSDWAEGGAHLFAQCLEFAGATQTIEMYKKTLSAAILWVKKEG